MSGKPNKGGRGRQNWGTPQWLFDRIEAELNVKFDVDVCAEWWSSKCPVSTLDVGWLRRRSLGTL